MADNISGLDRLKSQLLTSGLSREDQPLFQVINQLIDFLRNVQIGVTTIKEIQTTIVGNYAKLDSSNIFTKINPLITPLESWIGPSATTGVYFKGGNVGIGIISPTSLLTVNDALTVDSGGNVSGGFADPNLIIRPVRFNATGTNQISYLNNTVPTFPAFSFNYSSTAVANTSAAIFSRISPIPSASTAAVYYGVFGLVEIPLGSNLSGTSSAIGVRGRVESYDIGTISNLFGINGVVNNRGNGSVTNLDGANFTAANISAGAVTNLYGLIVQAQNNGAGVITRAAAVEGDIYNQGAGSITTAYGGFFSVNIVAGSIGTAYGVYIENINATTKWGLYQADSAAPNYFAGNVGIGTFILDSKLTVSANSTVLPASISGTIAHFGQADGVSTRLLFDSFGAQPALSFRLANNTAASPTAVANSDTLLNIGGFGYGATGYVAGAKAAIFYSAEQAWTDTAAGTRITFHTTPNGTTALTERARIDNSGNVGIGSTSPQYKLVVSNANVEGFEVSPGGGNILVQAFNRFTSAYIPFIISGSAIHLQISGITKAFIDTTGNIGFGQNTPTATLHLKAGTAAANTAPVKLTSGTNLTTPEAGTIEYNGTDFFLTP